MQDNVKAHLKNLLVSFSVFIISIILLFLPGDSRKVSDVGYALPKNFIKHVENGVTYYGERDFTVSYYTTHSGNGLPAIVSVSSETNPTVSIWVFYNSGQSKSSVFTPKSADHLGNATWLWTIPQKTSTERIRVVLRSENCYAELFITVYIND